MPVAVGMLHQKSATGLISRLLIRMACSYLHLCNGSNVKGYPEKRGNDAKAYS